MSALDLPDDLVPPSIPRRSTEQRDADAVGFRALRSLGIEQAQAASGRVWTDYNLHDPGVTILEQLCYALTELAYRADLPVADHLCRPDGTIDFHRQALFPPDEILRCRPTTANDYRRILLDGIEGLADARFVADDAQDRGRVPGLHRLRLRLTGARAAQKDAMIASSAEARRLYRAVRGLGEDLSEQVLEIDSRGCELVLHASISGTRDPADILADIYRDCGTRIAGLAPSRSLAELVAAGRPLEDILNGPELNSGVIEEDDLSAGTKGRLVVSDLRAIVLGVEGVVEVLKLELHIDGEPLSSAPEWPADVWAPRLRAPGDGDHAEDLRLLERVKLYRRGAEAPIDVRAVARRRAAPVGPRPGATAKRPFDKILPPPRGVYRAPAPFRSVQEEFPTIYGLGRRAAPMGGGPPAPSPADQLRGYLALFDQLLANGGEQVAHIRDLFTADHELERSYWPRILRDVDVPGVEMLYRAPREEIADQVYAPFDNAAERRGRALDYLLSLYGESTSQNTMRQYLDYLDSVELAEALLANKAEYLKQTVILGRDRAAGFDTGVDLWANPEATPGLQRRIGLLLGFKDWRARRLASGLGRWQVGRRSGAAPTRPPADERTVALTWPLAPEPPSSSPGDDESDAAFERLQADRALHADLFLHGVNRERYRWKPESRGKAGHLLLFDHKERWRGDLGRFSSPAVAGRTAERLRRRLLELNDASDGLHVVEHVLLRPRGSGHEPIDTGFHALRVTVVFPSWTTRTIRTAFQDFAAETVEINAPAHVLAECLWLDFARMRTFETRYAVWAAALVRYEAAVGEPAKVEAALGPLNDAAAKLTTFLKTELDRQREERLAWAEQGR